MILQKDVEHWYWTERKNTRKRRKSSKTDQLGPTKWDGHWQLPAAHMPPLQKTPCTRPQTAAAGSTSKSATRKPNIEECVFGNSVQGRDIVGNTRRSFATAFETSPRNTFKMRKRGLTACTSCCPLSALSDLGATTTKMRWPCRNPLGFLRRRDLRTKFNI